MLNCSNSGTIDQTIVVRERETREEILHELRQAHKRALQWGRDNKKYYTTLTVSRIENESFVIRSSVGESDKTIDKYYIKESNMTNLIQNAKRVRDMHEKYKLVTIGQIQPDDSDWDDMSICGIANMLRLEYDNETYNDMKHEAAYIFIDQDETGALRNVYAFLGRSTTLWLNAILTPIIVDYDEYYYKIEP
jgi:hypothetical protein